MPTFAEILEPVREQRPSRGGKPSRPTNKPSRREGDAGRPSRASFSEERSPDGRRKFSLPSSEGQSSRGPREDRPYGDRPQGDRPARSFGDKPAWGDKTPKSFGAGPKRGVRGDREYWEKKQQQRGKPRYKTAEEFAPSTDDMRLNRFLAHAGICSRRDADALIADGMVTVNGKIITEMGFKVGPGDEVRYAGERLKSERKVYVLLNKPK